MMTFPDSVLQFTYSHSPYYKSSCNDLSQLIEQSQQKVVSQVNNALTILFWNIGRRINEEVLKNKRAEYAGQIVSTVSTQLKNQYGKNFEMRNLRRMMQFATQFTDLNILISLSSYLSWSHFVELLPLKSQEARLFYTRLAVDGTIGTRDLRDCEYAL